LIDHVLNMGVMFLFQMIEAPLFGNKLLDRNAPLAALALNQAILRDATRKIQR